MEKIYMNENKNKKHSVINTSVVLSFVVSLFAIFSLAVFGIVNAQGTAVSYAAPTPLDPETSSITFNIMNGGATRVVSETGFEAPLYIANNNPDNPIFCVEHNTSVIDATSYNQGNTIEDYGLLYLLNHTYAYNKSVTNATGDNAKYVESWVTQVAIWEYLRSTDANSVNYLSNEDDTKIKNAKSLDLIVNDSERTTIYTAPEGKTIYEKYIAGLVSAAKNASNVYKIDAQFDGNIKLTSDKKYYQTGKITVVTSDANDLKNFDIELKGIDSAEVVDANGKKLESLTSVAPNTAFYIRVPADKVTEKAQKLNVDVVGHFNSIAGKYFTTASKDGEGKTLQKVVSVTATTIKVRDKIEVEFVGTPDTGMNTAQTIYFIGLIVLLCGVGIVYANAKPVQVK